MLIKNLILILFFSSHHVIYGQETVKNFYPTGELESTGKYLNREKHGEWKYYYRSGELKSIGSYDSENDGTITGTWKFFYENGKVKETGQFSEHGNRTGVWKKYHENGQLSEIGTYDSGFRNGEWQFFHPNGNLHQKLNFYSNGKIADGEKISYHDNGKIKSKGSSLRSVPDGLWKFFYKNGKIAAKGEFQNGSLKPEWRFYKEDGDLFLETVDGHPKSIQWMVFMEDFFKEWLTVYSE